jgi:hypothetical protein
MSHDSGLTDEEAKALVDKTICGVPVKLPYVFLRWVTMVTLREEQVSRLDYTGAELDREMLARTTAQAAALREQMNRLFP